MADEPENLTLRLLQEMRAENAAFRVEVRGSFEKVAAETARVRAEVAEVKADVLATKSLVFDVVVKLTALERRVSVLEDAPKP